MRLNAAEITRLDADIVQKEQLSSYLLEQQKGLKAVRESIHGLAKERGLLDRYLVEARNALDASTQDQNDIRSWQAALAQIAHVVTGSDKELLEGLLAHIELVQGSKSSETVARALEAVRSRDISLLLIVTGGEAEALFAQSSLKLSENEALQNEAKASLISRHELANKLKDSLEKAKEQLSTAEAQTC